MKLNWGILGAAKIALEKVIPAMADSDLFEVKAIASRSLEKAKAAAERLGIQNYYGSYEDLIADPEIDVVYIPLPNEQHVHYTLKCIEAGKHVLCEKPFALTSEEIYPLIKARDKAGVKVGEAFMVKSHPQWKKVRELLQNKELGELKAVQGFFSYYNINPDNIRNKPENGGGAIWDIGCYPVFTSRMALEEEPVRLVALLDFDPEFGTDRLGTVILQFPSVQMSFTVSTQLTPYQRMRFYGDKKDLEVVIPFNSPADIPTKLKVNNGDIFLDNLQTITIDTCNQYRLQAEEFSKAITENTEVPVSLESALANTKVLEAIFVSAKENRWVDID